MKGKHLLVALVIAGMVCGIVGYIYFGSVQKEGEKSFHSLSEADKQRLVDAVTSRLEGHGLFDEIVGFGYTKDGFEILFKEKADPQIIAIVREFIGELPLSVIENATCETIPPITISPTPTLSPIGPLKPFPSFVVNYLNVTLEEAFATVHIHRGSLTTITIAVDRVREDVTEFAPLIYVSSEMFTGGRDEAKLVDRINNYVDGMTINLNPLNIIFSGVEKRAYAKLTINVSQDVNPGTYWFEILVPLKEGKEFGLHSLRIIVEG